MKFRVQLLQEEEYMVEEKYNICLNACQMYAETKSSKEGSQLAWMWPKMILQKSCIFISSIYSILHYSKVQII
jgi:hypothetical protein